MTITVSDTEAYEKLKEYNGDNNFVNSLKSWFLKKNFLTQRQLICLVKNFWGNDAQVQISPEKNSEENHQEEKKEFIPIKLKKSVLIKLKGIRFVKNLCQNTLQLGKVNSYAWVVKEITGETFRAIKIRAEIPDNRYTLNFCRNCGRQLTDISEVQKFHIELDRVIEQIGEKEFWVPKRMIDPEYFKTLTEEIIKSKSINVIVDEQKVPDGLDWNDLI